MTSYTNAMLKLTPTIIRLGLHGCALLLLLAGGCATWRFQALRESRFIDMDGVVLHVAYGEEQHTETLPNGMTFTFNNKVLVTLPSGQKILLYQSLSASGIRYASRDKLYILHEKGPYVILLQNNQLLFEGVFCRQ